MVTKISTPDMSREEWLEKRRESIGGSDAAALLGLNKYSSPYALWAEKTGRITPEDISEKEAVRLGNDLEQYVADRWTEATGKKVRRDNHIIYNDAYPFAHANIDRAVVGENAGLMEGEIAKALPSVITPERFTRMVLSALSVNPKLSLCTPQSFLGAMMTAAQLGVEPNTALGQAYLIPFKNHGTMEAQFQLGYKGLIDLAYRSGEVSIIQAHVVYEADEFTYELGLDPQLKHVPAKSNRGKPVAYYAMFKTKDGGYGFEVMSVEDVVEHAKRYSKSFGNGPWQTNFDEMAKKTVLKRVLKYAPLKSDFARGIAQDETVKSTINPDMYAVPNEVIFEVDEETGEVIGGGEDA